MDDRFSHLPWKELWHIQGEIPWPTLETFAEAVVAEPGVAEELFKTYEQARETALDKVCYVELYVPTIFALAAPKLDEDRRRAIGEFLVKKLAEAGRDGDDVMMEVLVAASGSMGPIIVPAVLDTIAAEPDSGGAWIFLWNLTALTAKTDDAALRDQAVQACVGLLERADRGEVEVDDGIEAAHTLALLGRVEYTELVERLGKKSDPFAGREDYEEAVELLSGSADGDEWSESWEEPVRDWLEYHWQEMREWFAERDAEETDIDPTEPRNLVRRFLNSAWATNLPNDLLEDALYITSQLLEYAQTYEGAGPDELDEQVLRSVLLDAFPHKITGDRDFFAKVAPIVEAFLGWMGSEGTLANASAFAQAVHGWSEEIVATAMDSKNWGPAKTMTMNARRLAWIPRMRTLCRDSGTSRPCDPSNPLSKRLPLMWMSPGSRPSAHRRAHPKDRPQRALSVRQRQKVQEVLWQPGQGPSGKHAIEQPLIRKGKMAMIEKYTRHTSISMAALFVLAFLQISHAAEPARLYVSPQGKDSWSGKLDSPNEGRTDGPFATLGAARQAIRAMKKAAGLPAGGVTVRIGPGEYYLEQGFELTAEDSGTAESPIVYRAMANARLLGGREISTWRKVEDQAILSRLDPAARDSVRQADLKALGIASFGQFAAAVSVGQ